MISYLITFHTHSGALSFASLLEKLGIDIKMMPVPRKVSSSCGTGLRAISEHDICAHVTDDVDCVYTVDGTEYTKIYQCKD